MAHGGMQFTVESKAWWSLTVLRAPHSSADRDWLASPSPFLFTLGYLPMGWYYTHSEGSSHNLNPYGNNFTDTSGNEPSRAFLTQPSDNEDLPPQCHA